MAGGRPLVLDWQATAETRGAAYRAERNPEVRPRLHALWLLRQGRRLTDSATVVGVHYRTVQTWLRWYRQGGLADLRGHHQAGRGRESWLTAAPQAQVVEQAAPGAFFTAQDVQPWLAEHFGVPYRRNSLYGLLARLGCRLQVPRPYNPRRSRAEPAAGKGGARRSPHERRGDHDRRAGVGGCEAPGAARRGAPRLGAPGWQSPPGTGADVWVALSRAGGA
jgi:transposase